MSRPSSSTPGPKRKCERCKGAFSNHSADGFLVCPDGSGRRFRMHNNSGASQSFSPAEVAWLDACMRGMLMGGASVQLAKKPELASIARKVQVMKAAIARRKVQA